MITLALVLDYKAIFDLAEPLGYKGTLPFLDLSFLVEDCVAFRALLSHC